MVLVCTVMLHIEKTDVTFKILGQVGLILTVQALSWPHLMTVKTRKGKFYFGKDNVHPDL